MIKHPSFQYIEDHELNNHSTLQIEYGPAPSMELYTVREAVNGKYVKTKKISKFSKYYMDNYIQKKEDEFNK